MHNVLKLMILKNLRIHGLRTVKIFTFCFMKKTIEYFFNLNHSLLSIRDSLVHNARHGGVCGKISWEVFFYALYLIFIDFVMFYVWIKWAVITTDVWSCFVGNKGQWAIKNRKFLFIFREPILSIKTLVIH